MNRSSEHQALIHLFNAVRDFVLMAGGDGDGWVICKSDDYKVIADQFEEFEKNGERWFLTRFDGSNYVTFYNGQESICFTNTREILPRWAGDIIVEI